MQEHRGAPPSPYQAKNEQGPVKLWYEDVLEDCDEVKKFKPDKHGMIPPCHNIFQYTGRTYPNLEICENARGEFDPRNSDEESACGVDRPENKE